MSASHDLGFGLTDCHSHIYPDGYPGGGDLAAYRRLCRQLDIRRTVLVQPLALPDPNATTALSLVLECGRCILFFDEARLDRADLSKWHSECGVRGFRFISQAGEDLDPGALKSAAGIAARHGWHLHIQAEAETLVRHLDTLSSLACPVILDHLARLPRDPTSAEILAKPLLEFLSGGGWMKLSAPYNITADGRSDFRPLAPFLHASADVAVDRLIWAANHPHPNLPAGRKPDESATLQSLLEVFPETEIRRKIFSGNPQRLFGFT